MATSVLTSKLTQRSQTTIPKAVKNALRVTAGDEIGYVIEGDSVRLVNVASQAEHDDPMVARFLDLLARDIGQGNVQALTLQLVEQLKSLAGGVAVDHDAEITGAVAL